MRGRAGQGILFQHRFWGKQTSATKPCAWLSSLRQPWLLSGSDHGYNLFLWSEALIELGLFCVFGSPSSLVNRPSYLQLSSWVQIQNKPMFDGHVCSLFYSWPSQVFIPCYHLKLCCVSFLVFFFDLCIHVCNVVVMPTALIHNIVLGLVAYLQTPLALSSNFWLTHFISFVVLPYCVYLYNVLLVKGLWIH